MGTVRALGVVLVSVGLLGRLYGVWAKEAQEGCRCCICLFPSCGIDLTSVLTKVLDTGGNEKRRGDGEWSMMTRRFCFSRLF